MKRRCTDPKNKSYKDYGGRGIKVCNGWNVFENFFYDMVNDYKSNLTLDRKNNDGNYEKNNCKWSTKLEQANNKRISKHITIGDLKLTVPEWGRLQNIKAGTIHRRIYNGWSEEDAVTTPVQTRPQELGL